MDFFSRPNSFSATQIIEILVPVLHCRLTSTPLSWRGFPSDYPSLEILSGACPDARTRAFMESNSKIEPKLSLSSVASLFSVCKCFHPSLTSCWAAFGSLWRWNSNRSLIFTLYTTIDTLIPVTFVQNSTKMIIKKKVRLLYTFLTLV